MTTRIDFPLADGTRSAGELALPAGQTRSPAVLVVHEWWGINDDIRRITERFAAEGFVALAVDLYGGRTTADASEALKLANELQTRSAMEVIAAAAAFLGADPHTNGKVGVTGFCLGGAMALAAACNVEGLSAAVPFYGTPKDEFADFTRAKAPIQGHYGSQDGFVSLARAQALKARAEEAGASFELCVYEAGHAFLREGDPAAYHAESAKLAWERAVAFLHAQLG